MLVSHLSRGALSVGRGAWRVVVAVVVSCGPAPVDGAAAAVTASDVAAAAAAPAAAAPAAAAAAAVTEEATAVVAVRRMPATLLAR
jgi:hypothetical protein